MNTAEAHALCQAAENCLHKAQTLLDNGPLVAEAATLYLQATELDPDSVLPYLGLACIGYAMGDQAQSVGLLMQAQALEPHNLKVAQLLQRFQKKAPPAPPPTQSVRSLNPGVLLASVSFDTPNPTPERLAQAIGLAPHAIQSGPQVALLQTALQAIGFSLAVTDSFDGPTLKALQAYQYKLKRPVTGVSDAVIHQHLNRVLDKLATDPDYFHTPSEPESPPPPDISQPQLLVTDLGPAPLKGKVHSGPEVRLLQETLDALGFSVANTGDYDAQTSQAVRAFQRQQKLPLTGWVDGKTRSTLNPLITLAINRKEHQQALKTEIQAYWHTQGYAPSLLWEHVLEQTLKQLMNGEDRPDTPPPLPPWRDKPLIQQVLGSPGEHHTLSEGPLITRLQELLQAQGMVVKVTHHFDLQTLVALRQFLTALGLPAHDRVDASNWGPINALLVAQYARETIRETLYEQLYKGGQWSPEKLHQTLAQQLFPLLEQTQLPPLTQELGPPGRYGKVSSGIEVGILQYRLQQAGYECPVTLAFDAPTQAALKTWQLAHQLTPTGMVDAQTLAHWSSSEP